MKKLKLCLISMSVIAIIGVAVAYAIANHDDFFFAGQYLKAANEQTNKSYGDENTHQVAAAYNGQEILMSAVEYQRKLNILRDEETAKEYETDIDIVNHIIEDMILLEEAERRGLSATQEEIDEMVAAVQQAYEIPEGKEMMDSYCAGAGITVEEYYELIREIAPGSIARQKLRDEIGREYCEKNGIEFTKVNPPEEMIAAQDAFVSELFEMHKDEIEYYIDLD